MSKWLLPAVLVITAPLSLTGCAYPKHTAMVELADAPPPPPHAIAPPPPSAAEAVEAAERAEDVVTTIQLGGDLAAMFLAGALHR